jgi:uncharacterized protein YdiU (UPF0061 family)
VAGLGPDPDVMDRTNPVYIPRNHLVEEALAAATTGDLDPLERLLAVVASPYEDTSRSGRRNPSSRFTSGRQPRAVRVRRWSNQWAVASCSARKRVSGGTERRRVAAQTPRPRHRPR